MPEGCLQPLLGLDKWWCWRSKQVPDMFCSTPTTSAQTGPVLDSFRHIAAFKLKGTVMSNASLWRNWCMWESCLFICPHPEEAEVEVSGSVSWQWFNILLRMTSYPGSSKCSDCVSLKGPQNSPTFFFTKHWSVKENQTHADSDGYKSERVEDKPISLTSCPFVPGVSSTDSPVFLFSGNS